jgi:hypothetical protein
MEKRKPLILGELLSHPRQSRDAGISSSHVRVTEISQNCHKILGHEKGMTLKPRRGSCHSALNKQRRKRTQTLIKHSFG